MNENENIDRSEDQQSELVKTNFSEEIDSFIKHIESQADIVPLVMGLLSIKLVQESKHVDKFIKENSLVEKTENGEEKGKLIIPSEKFKDFVDLNDKVGTTSLAYNLLPINFVVSFVSQYDA
jgi:hypothetical protein